jgi:hypothetical protein
VKIGWHSFVCLWASSTASYKSVASIVEKGNSLMAMSIQSYMNQPRQQLCNFGAALSINPRDVLVSAHSSLSYNKRQPPYYIATVLASCAIRMPLLVQKHAVQRTNDILQFVNIHNDMPAS